MGPVSPWCCNQRPGRQKTQTVPKSVNEETVQTKRRTSLIVKQEKCHGNREEFPAADQEPPKR